MDVTLNYYNNTTKINKNFKIIQSTLKLSLDDSLNSNLQNNNLLDINLIDYMLFKCHTNGIYFNTNLYSNTENKNTIFFKGEVDLRFEDYNYIIEPNIFLIQLNNTINQVKKYIFDIKEILPILYENDINYVSDMYSNINSIDLSNIHNIIESNKKREKGIYLHFDLHYELYNILINLLTLKYNEIPNNTILSIYNNYRKNVDELAYFKTILKNDYNILND